MNVGDKIKVKDGWGYNPQDEQGRVGFDVADEPTFGIVIAKRHKNPNTFYFRLEDGRVASTAISGVEVVE